MKKETSNFFRRLYHASIGFGWYWEIRALPSRRQFFCGSSAEIDAAIEQCPGENIYFGVGMRKEKRGTADAVAAIPGLWVDVDAKDFGGDKRLALEALRKNPAGDWTLIVETGGGYHAYLVFEEPALPPAFGKIIQLNRALARVVGGDMKSTDIARILRVPGTENIKYDPPRPVRLINVTESRVTMKILDEILKIDEPVVEEYVPPKGFDSEEVRRVMSCGYMRWCASNASHLPEPAWYAMISNLCGFRGSPRVIHELSRPYPKYSSRETDEKILHALDASAPISCEKCREIYDCHQDCGVKSPAGLAWRGTRAIEEDNPFAERDTRIKKVVEVAIPGKGFVREYVDYATTLTDAPKIFHLFSALSVLSAVTGRRASCPGFGGRPLFPNLWTILIAPSSVYRKSTALAIASDFLRNTRINLMPQEFSREVLVSTLNSNPHGSFVWSEFGAVLGNLNREYMAGTKDLLADLYDCPESYERKLVDKHLVVTKPFITILGATNVDWMLDKDVKSDLRGGFLARMLYVPFTSKDFEMDMPGTPDGYARNRLLGSLLDIEERAPVTFGIEHLREMYREMREELKAAADRSEYFVELSASFTRFQSVAYKIATLMAIAEGNWGGEIPLSCMENAVNCIRLLRLAIEDLMESVPMNRDDKLLVEVVMKMKVLHASGEAWIPKGKLIKYLHRKASTLDPVLDTLEEMGRIRRLDLGGRGRPGVSYQVV